MSISKILLFLLLLSCSHRTLERKVAAEKVPQFGCFLVSYLVPENSPHLEQKRIENLGFSTPSEEGQVVEGVSSTLGFEMEAELDSDGEMALNIEGKLAKSGKFGEGIRAELDHDLAQEHYEKINSKSTYHLNRAHVFCTPDLYWNLK